MGRRSHLVSGRVFFSVCFNSQGFFPKISHLAWDFEHMLLQGHPLKVVHKPWLVWLRGLSASL